MSGVYNKTLCDYIFQADEAVALPAFVLVRCQYYPHPYHNEHPDAAIPNLKLDTFKTR